MTTTCGEASERVRSVTSNLHDAAVVTPRTIGSRSPSDRALAVHPFRGVPFRDTRSIDRRNLAPKHVTTDASCVSPVRVQAVRLRSLVTTLLAVVAVAGCGVSDVDGLPMSVAFENRTDEAISIIWHRKSGEEISVARDVSPGKSAYLDVNEYGDPEAVCGDGELVAVDAAGREVARSQTPCTHWVIESSELPE